MDKYIGFDVSSKSITACVIDGRDDEQYETLPVDLPVLAEWLGRQRDRKDRVHLTFEVSGQSGWLYDGLIERVDTLTVSNPSELTWIFRTRKKTDRIDAYKQARLLKAGLIPAVHMPTADIRRWRQRIQHRRGLITSVVRTKNRIRALVKGQGYPRAPHRGSWWHQLNRAWLWEIAREGGVDWREDLEDLLEQLALYEDQLRRVTKRLDERLKHHAGAALLMSIPGVGPRTAEAVLAHTDEVERFRRGKEYCSYFGMTPKLDQSGTVCRQGHISKQGPSVVRWLLVECAWRAIRTSPSLRAFYERVLGGQKKRKKIAIVAVARKLLSVMRAMLLSGSVFEEHLVLQQEQIHRATEQRQQEAEEQSRRRKAFYQ